MSPSNRIAVTEPAAEDFEQLPFWYCLVGIDQEDYSSEIDGFTSALQDGYLGAAVGKPGKPGRDKFATLMDLDQSRAYYARTSVRVLRLNGEPIGILIMGAHWRLWEMMKERGAHLAGATVDGFPRGEVDFMIAETRPQSSRRARDDRSVLGAEYSGAGLCEAQFPLHFGPKSVVIKSCVQQLSTEKLHVDECLLDVVANCVLSMQPVA